MAFCTTFALAKGLEPCYSIARKGDSNVLTNPDPKSKMKGESNVLKNPVRLRISQSPGRR